MTFYHYHDDVGVTNHTTGSSDSHFSTKTDTITNTGIGVDVDTVVESVMDNVDETEIDYDDEVTTTIALLENEILVYKENCQEKNGTTYLIASDLMSSF